MKETNCGQSIYKENGLELVYWITGLSGAGKTTIGKLFYKKMKEQYANTVFLDGGTMRKVFGGI